MAEAADNAVQVVVSGKRNRVSVTAAQAVGAKTAATVEPAPVESHSPFWTRSRRIGAFAVGVATIVGAVAAVLAIVD